MKILMTSSLTENDNQFPMKLWVLDLPFDFQVGRDPLGMFLPDAFIEAQRDVIEQMFNEKVNEPSFVINECQPEWIKYGHELIKNHGDEIVDDNTAAAVYIQYTIMTITDCAAVYDLIWY